MPPGAATGRSSAALFRPDRVEGRRFRVEVAGVPVRAPLVDVRGYSVEAEPVRVAQPYRPGAVERAVAFVGDPSRDPVAPRVALTIRPATCRSLPLRFGRQTHRWLALGAPGAIRLRVMPADPHDRLIRPTERRVVPLARLFVPGVLQEHRVLATGDRIHRHLIRVHPDPVHRALGLLALVAAHEEPAAPDGDEL